MDAPEPLSTRERELILQVARCELLNPAHQDDHHPCHAVVDSQGMADEQDRQVPEAWAGNLRRSRVVFLSSNPSISEAAPGLPLDSAEDYPRASWSDDDIVEFQGRRFDQSLAKPFVTNGRFLQRDGQYAGNPVRFWSSIHQRAVELLGPTADPTVNYVMTEVVHCKSKHEVGVDQAAATCAQQHLNDLLFVTSAPVVVVVGRRAHDCLNGTVGLELPEPPYITSGELGGRERLLVYIWHPAGFKGPKKLAGLYGESELQRLRGVLDPS